MPYTEEQLNDLPADSYDGRERDLCDLLTADTMDWVYSVTEFYEDDDLEREAFLIFMMLMMNEAAFAALTDDIEGRWELRAQVQDDARDDSGEAFRQRLAQRLAHYRTLIRLTSEFRAHTKEN
jgi:hypothetical protein